MNQQLNKQDYLIDFSNAYKDIKADKKEIVHYISSEEKNGKGQYLPISGYKDEKYRKKPMVLFNHGVDALFLEPTDPRESLMYVIGTNMHVTASGNYLKAGTKFKEDNPFAMDLFRAYEQGYMHSWSKRWQNISPILFAEDGSITVNEWTIREYSSVFIPADDGATTLMENSGDFKSDIFLNCIKDYAFTNKVTKEVENDSDVAKLQNEINELKNTLNQLPNELIEYVNNAIKHLAEINKGKFLAIAGDINSVAKSVVKINSNMETKINKVATDIITGVIRKSTGHLN